MTAITNSAQLSLFSTIRSIIKNNATLTAKFNDNNILQYFPKVKSAGFKGFPFITISIPSTVTDLLVMNHAATLKDFDVTIYIAVEYLAKDNFLSYLNALVYAIEADTTLASAGYFNTRIEVEDVDAQAVISEKECVVATLSLKLRGPVAR